MSEPVSAVTTCPPLTLEQLDNLAKVITDFLDSVEDDGRLADHYTQSWSIDTIGVSGRRIRVLLSNKAIKTRNRGVIRSEIKRAIDRLKKKFKSEHAGWQIPFDKNTYINVAITWSGNNRKFPIRAPVVPVPLLR